MNFARSYVVTWVKSSYFNRNRPYKVDCIPWPTSNRLPLVLSRLARLSPWHLWLASQTCRFASWWRRSARAGLSARWWQAKRWCRPSPRPATAPSLAMIRRARRCRLLGAMPIGWPRLQNWWRIMVLPLSTSTWVVRPKRSQAAILDRRYCATLIMRCD